MKKSDFPVVSMVLFFITAIVTVILFYYLSEEKSRSSLFVFNLIYICFLEFLFFGYIALIRYSKVHTSSIYAAGGTLIISYILIAAVILFSYNLFFHQFLSDKFYISALVIGSILTIVIYGFLIKLDTHHTATKEVDKSKRISLQLIQQKYELLQGSFERVVKSKNLVEKNESAFANSLEKLTTKIKFLPPSAMDNVNFLTIIQNYEQDLKQTINQLEMAESGTEKDLKNKIENIVSDAILNIESSKNIFLK